MNNQSNNNQSNNDYDKNLSWSENLEYSSADAESDAEKEDKKRLLMPVVKAFFMAFVVLAVLVFAGIAWFTISGSLDTDGMTVTVASSLFELKTSGTSGLYDGDGFLSEVAPGYISALTTEEGVGIKWKLVSSDSEMNNLYKGQGQPDLREITRQDSDQYGLKPGDYGTLQFTIEPKTNDTLEIQCIMSTTGYKATYDSGSYKTRAPMTQVSSGSSESIVRFLSSHILYFYVGEDNHKHMLTEDGFEEIVENGQDKEVTLYWVWPATLKEILDGKIDGLYYSGGSGTVYDQIAAVEVKRFFFEHPEYFLKPIGGETFEGFTVPCMEDKAAEDIRIQQVISQVTGKNYNKYGAMYNDADQAIGDNVNYILVELFARLKMK